MYPALQSGLLGDAMLRDLYNEERVKVSDADLVRMLAGHEHYATGRGGTRAQFQFADLDGQVLANRNLDEAEFTGASLVGANLFGSSLVRASLYCADLRNCNLRSSKLVRADMRGASFKGADLSNSVLDGADLRAATMMFVRTHKVSVVDRSATPEGMFGGVDFSNCSLRNTSFNNAKLDGANFSGSLLVGTQFRGARLSEARFDGAVLMGVNVAELKVPPEALKNCVMDSSPKACSNAPRLKEILVEHRRWVETGGKQGAGAVLDGQDLRPLHDCLSGRDLIGLHAHNVVAIGVDFSECHLQGARFDGADLRGSSFRNADLSGVSFKSANLTHARFDNARFGTLQLRDGGTLPPNLEGAGAFAEQFRTALFDDEHILAGLPSMTRSGSAAA
jgi:uncharacterized protein YjbI with pentapeptide repeats